jgi:hypothetical protein
MTMRATSFRNEAVRRVAASPGVVLADAEKMFEESTSHGCPGDEWFYDHVHLRPEGALMLARCWARALEQGGLLGPQAGWDWSRARPQPEVERAIGLTPKRLAKAHALIGRRCAEAEAGGLRVEAFRRPQFVEGLRARGSEEFARALRLDPHAAGECLKVLEPFTYCYVAMAYTRLGRPGDALMIYDGLLDAIPTFVLAYKGKIEAHEARGETAAAAAARARLVEIERPGTGPKDDVVRERKEAAP